ncbi:hypothetical protein [Natronosalvus caseinilyticus]|uniref:hypothetical protein n=1 Tax=Natronosalvus caseinilyticus TaxID=2953747 RepID=UPI0028AFD3C6|nr:hypothetical protein [Natronosalvus caseinilyticus]
MGDEDSDGSQTDDRGNQGEKTARATPSVPTDRNSSESNETHMLVSVTVRVQFEACLAEMMPLVRDVLDTLEVNADAER